MTSKLANTDWLAIVIYPLAVILMEAFWVYPWLVWLGVWPIFTEQRPSLGLASVIITLAVSLLVTKLSFRQKWPMRLIQSVVVGCGLVTILLVLHFEYSAGHEQTSSGSILIKATNARSGSNAVISIVEWVEQIQ